MGARVSLIAGLLLCLCTVPAFACLSTPEQRAERFAALDEDSDGVISLREYFRQSPLGGISAEKEQELFAVHDTDGDGSLSQEEFFAQLAQQRC